MTSKDGGRTRMNKKVLNNGYVKGVTAAVAVILLIAAVVKAYAVINERQKVETEARQTLKDEGCMPARRNVTTIEVVKTKVEEIDETQKEMRKENKESFKKILTELQKKPKKRSFIFF